RNKKVQISTLPEPPTAEIVLTSVSWLIWSSHALLLLGFVGLSLNALTESRYESWICSFPDSILRHIARVRSDHRPILLDMAVAGCPHPSQCPFHFTASWLAHEEFLRILSAFWNNDRTLPHALKHLAGRLRRWNVEVFGHIVTRKWALMGRYAEMKAFSASSETPVSKKLAEATRRELETTILQESVMCCRNLERTSFWTATATRDTSTS
ncbi:hypothetical protein LINGRAHAP2_LOCUS36507, partial [Linum grandiflorum]